MELDTERAEQLPAELTPDRYDAGGLRASRGEIAIKATVLKDLDFGARVAEDEATALASYFVETEQWNQVWNDDVDIVYGAKGAGKSAIYATLVAREPQLLDRDIIISPAENPQGSPAFSSLPRDEKISEDQFTFLWKLYLLSVIVDKLQDQGINNSDVRELVKTLSDEGVLPGRRVSLKKKLANVWAYIRRDIGEIEPNLDGLGGVVSGGLRIQFREPTPGQRSAGAVAVDDLLEKADNALRRADLSLWLLIDRLDVAFAGDPDLEQSALRALFKVYLDMGSIDRIRLKIFLRSDIWKAITEKGFREASHITRELTLQWDYDSLLQLTTQRLIRSPKLRAFYNVPNVTVLPTDDQHDLFLRVCPPQVENGPNKPMTFAWCLSRTSDASKQTAPRELIHLLSETRLVQLRRQELGQNAPAGSQLFDGISFKEALPAVSEVRLTKTIYAEHPDLREYIKALEGHKTHHNAQSLASIWEIPEEQAKTIATQLIEIGFFEKKPPQEFWVPFLYRPALGLVQGRADGVGVDAGSEE
ncbi:P-loop ATPase, Sll1717 family [Kitasatospora sp. NPDC051853]|uniref:P-loop ATPase, Sll1717 family n=1 Tax=Kitasatospora sp. NPDC051853 TaxID=3364058 RepID=UPI0037BD7602